MDHWQPDAYTWLGASGGATSPKDFRWIDPGAAFDFQPWRRGVAFRQKPEGTAYVFAYPTRGRGAGEFGFSGPAVTQRGLPFGYIVDYGPAPKGTSRDARR